MTYCVLRYMNEKKAHFRAHLGNIQCFWVKECMIWKKKARNEVTTSFHSLMNTGLVFSHNYPRFYNFNHTSNSLIFPDLLIKNLDIFTKMLLYM